MLTNIRSDHPKTYPIVPNQKPQTTVWNVYIIVDSAHSDPNHIKFLTVRIRMINDPGHSMFSSCHTWPWKMYHFRLISIFGSCDPSTAQEVAIVLQNHLFFLWIHKVFAVKKKQIAKYISTSPDGSLWMSLAVPFGVAHNPSKKETDVT